MRLRRRRRSPSHRGMSPFLAGLIAIVLISVGTYFGFTKANPFASPYELQAVFADASGIKANSPVRIAGVEVGKITQVESIDAGTGVARITMELKDDALPLHEDATAAIRPRIFLEGNFFVDLSPGSPSAPEMDDELALIPLERTRGPVQLGDVLNELETDVRKDLRTLLAEYSLKGLEGGGAEGFNRATVFFEDAYRSTAQVNDALLGTEPARDLQRVLRGQSRVAAALTVDEEGLKDFVTNLSTVVGALAREDSALRASVPALRDTLRTGQPALLSLDGALGPVRALAIDALPGVRSSVATLDAATPLVRQLRALVSESELRGTARELRLRIPALVRLNRRLIPFLSEGRELASCTNSVLIPFLRSPIPSGEEGNSGQLVREQIQRSFVGLAGESRTHDANTPFFRIQAVPPTNLALGEVQPVPPSDARTPPPHRPDVPCETQDPPNLNAPSGATADFSDSRVRPAATRRLRARLERTLSKSNLERLARSEGKDER